MTAAWNQRERVEQTWWIILIADAILFSTGARELAFALLTRIGFFRKHTKKFKLFEMAASILRRNYINTLFLKRPTRPILTI